MTEIENYISEQILQIVPNFDKLEFRANVGDSSHSVEFFVTVNGSRMQCYDMVDHGLIKEKELDAINKSIAKYIRASSTYVVGKVNKISAIICK